MTLGEKLRFLRTVEGRLRGRDSEMTQQEISRAIEGEVGVRISQSYLSQIERGVRPHLTNTSRMALARFFKVHPGYLAAPSSSPTTPKCATRFSNWQNIPIPAAAWR